MSAGAPQTSACPECGTACAAEARFCASCGTSLGFAAPAERRVITVLFADLSGFTTLTETLDPEEVHGLIASCLRPLCECVTRWGGFVDKFIGDCVMALFGAPVAYENEPERAIRAALDMQSALREWSEGSEGGSSVGAVDGPGGGTAAGSRSRLRLSIGVNTGPVVTGLFSGGGARDYTAIGDTVNVASRLQSVAEPGEILVGSASYEQTKHVFDFGPERVLHVKGRAEPVRARRVLGLRAERGEIRGFRGRRARLVGREPELARLRQEWQRAVGGEFRPVVVVGPSGIGKTRLVEELARREGLEREEIARGRCYPYARATPWEPLAELLQDLHGLPASLDGTTAAGQIAARVPGTWTREDVAALAAALGGSQAASEMTELGHEERGAGVTAVVARALWTPPDRPRLLVVEDLHWADRTSLEFLGRAGEFEVEGPILLALVTRPPLAGERLLWGLLEGTPTRIDLAPLSETAAGELVDELLGDHRLPSELLTLILQRAAGNPLFLEEILKALVERGDLAAVEGVWRVGREIDVSSVAVPESIETVLSTRIDQLDSSARRVLQYAAIVGRRFWSEAVAEALARHPVDRELTDLVDGRLVRPEAESAIPDSREFAFEHLLLQEVAYDGLLRGLRAEMHAAVAGWLESRLGSGAGEAGEWIAYHWERSDDPARALPYLERAAARVLERGARRDALALGERALAVAREPGDQFRILGLVEEVAASLGDPRRRRKAVDEMEALAAAHPGEARWRAEAGYRRARLLLAEGELDSAARVGAEALALFRRLDDVDREGDCATLLGRVAQLRGDYPKATAFYRNALVAQREVGDREGEADNLDRLGLVEVDVGDYTAAIRTFEEALDLCRALAHRPMESRLLAHTATALSCLGRLSEAEAMTREAIAIARACRSSRSALGAELTLGTVLTARRQPTEAARILRDVCARAAEAGRRSLESRAWLALAEIEDGEESLGYAVRAGELAAGTGLVHVCAMAANRRAELHLLRGEVEAADEASRSALEALRRHGSLQGPEERVLYTRCQVLRAVGREEEAAELLGEAAAVVHQTAGRIDDPEMRRVFLQRVELNRLILEAAAGDRRRVQEEGEAKKEVGAP